jgi:hypothetical protein
MRYGVAGVPPREDLLRRGGGNACDPDEIVAGASSSLEAGDIGRSAMASDFWELKLKLKMGS